MTKYLVLEEGTAITCDTPEQRVEVTRHLLGGADESETESNLQQLSENGYLHFESDPSICWQDVEVVSFDEFLLRLQPAT